jgi:RimJ/RimL family protein N-acetyltransferase
VVGLIGRANLESLVTAEDDLEAPVQAKEYSATEPMRSGLSIEFRALRPDDRAGLLAAVDRTSEQSLYRRFFAFKRGFTEREIDFYCNVDFVSHVALVAVSDDAGTTTIVGGARYIVAQPGQAEVAFAVGDAYQGQGIGSALLGHLVAIARQAGLKTLVADVLPENTAMLKIFEKSGIENRTRREQGVVHVSLQLSRMMP